ncbi:PRC-barrel domain-containing protein [Bacillus sp. JJ1764]|uniref:PRC-barrel domain-containing protein n=1 Tax=Bacillus sp. JJ1764 TaxID=3122964 RepID=UPI002FFF41E2
MRTFSLLKGQPVFELQHGTKIGEVCDLCISDAGIVKGLIIKKGAFFKQNCFLDIQKVASFGWDVVMVKDPSLLTKAKNSSENALSFQQSLDGMMLLSKSGESLGLLKDVYFQEELGTIVGYEITDGFFSDIMEGKKMIHSEKPLTIGKDAIIVDVNQT